MYNIFIYVSVLLYLPLCSKDTDSVLCRAAIECKKQQWKQIKSSQFSEITEGTRDKGEELTGVAFCNRSLPHNVFEVLPVSIVAQSHFVLLCYSYTLFLSIQTLKTIIIKIHFQQNSTPGSQPTNLGINLVVR